MRSPKIAKQILPQGAPVFKYSDPLLARVVSNKRISAPDSDDDIVHIVFDTSPSGLQFVEGQSVGVIPPGQREDGRPQKLRLYSVASGRWGEAGRPELLGLCVKRVVEQRPEGEFRGVASNYLCDLKPGDTVPMTGPVGKAFALPAEDDSHVIMLATGTGIAPFRSFLEFMYGGETPWRGQTRLFFGCKRDSEASYMNAADDSIRRYDGTPGYRSCRALSREQSNPDGSRVYVQHRLRENHEDIIELLRSDRCTIYQCGLKGMEQGIEEALIWICEQHGEDWSELKTQMRADGRWNVEVY